MAQFDYYLNRQGTRGPQGIQGEQGFSPIITVATNTLSEYVLQIQTQNNTFLTANLREHKDDLGGTYIRYNRETGVMFAGDADVASTSQMGVVRFATATDIEREDDSSVVSPADVADMLDDAGYSGDISDLKSDVHDLQLQVAANTQSISDNTSAIGSLQTSVTGLLANYVPKTRTINGYALSSNITLTASDVNAYSKSESDALLADKADVSDLPDMNNYYNTTQVDLMLNEKADISDIPTVGNGVITINQGGVQKGQFSLNQSGNATINLTDGGGGGGGSYTAGNGIDITNDVISAVPDGTTIDFNTDGELKVISAPTPNNMVTTDTTQTISGTKSFSNGVKATFVDDLDGGVIVSSLSGTMQVGNGTLNYLGIYTGGNSITVNRAGSNYVNIDSGNISSYAITSNPVMTGAASSTAGASGLVPQPVAGDDQKFLCGDGTFKTVSGGGSTYSAGIGIDITSDVISIDDDIVATKEDIPVLPSYTSPLVEVAATGYGANESMVPHTDGNNNYYSAQQTNSPGINTGSISFPSTPTHTNILDELDSRGFAYILLPYTTGDTVAMCQSVSSSATSGSHSGTRKHILFGNLDSNGVFTPLFFPLCERTRNVTIINSTSISGNSYQFNTSTSYPQGYSGTTQWGGNETFLQIYPTSSNAVKYTQIINGYCYSYTYDNNYAEYNAFMNANCILLMTGYVDSSSYVGYSGQPFNFGTGTDHFCGTAATRNIDIWTLGTDANALLSYFSNATNTLDPSQYTLQKQVKLNIGTGLSVVDGALTATATPVTVDQTYNSLSTNAQSGVAIAGAGFLTSIPTASTSTLGGVKVDGTTITIDGSGVISSSGGGGGSLPSQTGHDGGVLTTDGTDASWADTEAVHVVVETYVNGTSWYRVHSDGWCEQGDAGPVTFPATSTQFAFLKPFADTNYSVFTTPYRDNTGTYGDSIMVESKHAGYFYAHGAGQGATSSRTGLWYACGYIS